jgi:hypothetical protein
MVTKQYGSGGVTVTITRRYHVNMMFSKREQSFCVLEYARTLSVVTVPAANQGNYVGRLSHEKTLGSDSL